MEARNKIMEAEMKTMQNIMQLLSQVEDNPLAVELLINYQAVAARNKFLESKKEFENDI